MFAFSMRGIYTFLTIIFLCQAGVAQQCHNDSTGLIPINDLGAGFFAGMQGGLYGKGSNIIPDAHLNSGLTQASAIQPLDAQGNPSPNGRIGFISMGMSNANQFFGVFMSLSRNQANLNPQITMVNGATGGFDIDAMLDFQGEYWTRVDQKMNQAGLSNNQVQVIWFMQAKHILGIPANEGIEHIEITEEKFLRAFQYLKQRYPNLRQIFCSGRDYGGYSLPNRGNPEPYGYYTGWAFRKLVERQMNGDPQLSYEGENPRTAWLAWADYAWADGKNLRSDGLNWLCPDDYEDDGVHPNNQGRAKFARRLLNFFESDSTTHWYRANVITSLPHEIHTKHARLQIVPNPAKSVVEIVNVEDSFTFFRIIEANGKQILITESRHIDVATLSPGIYIVQAISGTNIKSARLVKN